MYRTGTCLLLISLMGCNASDKALKQRPDLNPAEAAAAAIAQYDTDQDGAIDATEAEASALDPRTGWDADGDGKISEEEIRTRLERYEAVQPGIMNFSCNVTLNGRPLQGAEVVFEPEEFLGGSIEVASGTTDDRGAAALVIPEVVERDRTLSGIRTGLYKVKITHPTQDIPAKYNTETELTFELSPIENVIPPTFRLRG